MDKTQAENFINSIDVAMNKPGVKHEVSKYTGNFTYMRISDIGFGKNEYKSSKPNILKNDAVVDEFLRISEAAEAAIGHTIGPYADATLIQTYADREVPVYNTRDGYTILKNMRFTQPIPNAIFNIIRSTSEYMQDNIGDSTSSGIPIQHALLKKFVEIFNDQTNGCWKFSPVGIKNISKICVKEIVKGFKDNPKYQKVFPRPDEKGKFTKEQEDDMIKWLTKVATISANNDYDIGAKIAELYRNKLDGRGHVIALKSPTEEEYIKDSNAFIIPIGMLDQEKMANSSDGFSWEAKDPLIAMFDGPLEETDLPGLKQIVQTAIFDLKRPLFITASLYNFHIAQYLKQCIDGTYYNELGEEISDPNSNKEAKPHRVDICGFILRNKELEEQYLFQDMVLMTDSHPFSTELGKLTEYSSDRKVRKTQIEKLFGTCEAINSSFGETQFIGCKPNTDKFDKLIGDLKAKREQLKSVKARLAMNDYSYDELGLRIDRLQARTTFFYCGGRTKSERHARQLIIEDAVASVASAIKNGGVSIGSNMSVSHYIEHNFDELVEHVIETINNIHINITASSNYDSLKNIVEIILSAIQFAFGNAYRYALYNMYRDPQVTMDKWESCVSCEIPSVYNIMTDRIEEFDANDPDKCTSLIVPRLTDECLLNIIIENVGSLINVGNMISLMSPNMDLEALQYKQLETGAAYMASNSIIRQ